MAWAFSLSAECGPEKEPAIAFIKYFDGFAATIEGGSIFPGTTSVVSDGTRWWGCVWPQGVSTSGIRNDAVARQMSHIGSQLYDRLRGAPAFRYALVGVEIDEFRCYDEMFDDIIVEHTDFEGLVLGDALWHRLQSPSVFAPFANGYHWRPFHGFCANIRD